MALGVRPHVSVPPVRSAWEAEDDGEEPEDELEAELEDELEDELDEGEADAEEDDVEQDEEQDGELDEELDDEHASDEDADETWSQGEADEDEADLEVLNEAPEDEPPLAEDPEVVADVAAAAAVALAEDDRPAPRAGRPAWEQAGLFDDEPVDAYGTPVELVDALRQANQETAARMSEPETAAAETVAAEEASPADDATEPETEPEVELEPRPPRAARSRSRPKDKPKAKDMAKATPEPAAAPDPADDLLFRAGMLFVERGRVAVSMLQRTFDLDFKQATALLDQLQDAGLIGPYLGGKKRDILLSAQEWRERRVGAS